MNIVSMNIILYFNMNINPQHLKNIVIKNDNLPENLPETIYQGIYQNIICKVKDL